MPVEALVIVAGRVHTKPLRKYLQSVDCYNDQLDILYIAPERMEHTAWITAAREMKIAMVVIDKAHCISMWGQSFRPNYRRIVNLVRLLPKSFPVLATTTTATPRVQ